MAETKRTKQGTARPPAREQNAKGGRLASRNEPSHEPRSLERDNRDKQQGGSATGQKKVRRRGEPSKDEK